MTYNPKKQKPTINPSELYNREQVEAFGQELHQLYLETKAKIGQEDLETMERLDALSKWFEGAGRGLIQISPGPLTWLSGTMLLAAHYVMEFTNGHNILHGHYDEFNHPRLNSEKFRWDLNVDETDWKFEHHTSHHPFTNVVGKDSDYGYLLYRANDDQPWHPRYLGQIGVVASIPFSIDKLMPWYIATARAIVEKRKIVSLQTYGRSVQRIANKFLKNYLLYPIMAGPFFPKVFMGNLLAEMLSNTHTIMMLAIEHHSEQIPMIEMSANETQAEFYLRQVMATQNYQLPSWYEDLFTGAVNIHIEHHLFPDLPFNRLKDMAPQVEQICQKYGVPYRNVGLWEAIGGMLSLVVEKSLPTRSSDESVWDLLQNPGELVSRIIDGFGEKFIHLEALNSQAFTQAKVKAVIPETASAVRLQLEVPSSLRRTTIRGGQYISLKLDVDGQEHVRQYSLIEPGRPDHLTVVVKHVPDGRVSGFINRRLKAGTKITIAGGIQGEFTYRPGSDLQVFIAGGVGITPIYSILNGIDGNGGRLDNCVLYYFNRNEQSIILNAEVNALRAKGLRVEHIISEEHGGFFENWFHSQYRAKSPDEGVNPSSNAEDSMSEAWGDVYACAPKGMLEHLKSMLDGARFDIHRYHTENFTVDKLKHKLTGKTHRLKLLSSKTNLIWDEGEPLLQALERGQIPVASGCRKGMCKACLVKVEKGRVVRKGQTEDLHSTYITACNTFPRSKATVWI